MQTVPYNYQLSDEAEADIEEGYLWYENQQLGLGEEFLTSLDQAKEAILSNPKTYRIRYRKRARSFVVGRFPYLVLYIIKGNNIDVVAVFNTHKHPNRWKKRIS